MPQKNQPLKLTGVSKIDPWISPISDYYVRQKRKNYIIQILTKYFNMKICFNKTSYDWQVCLKIYRNSFFIWLIRNYAQSAFICYSLLVIHWRIRKDKMTSCALYVIRNAFLINDTYLKRIMQSKPKWTIFIIMIICQISNM